MGISVPPSAAAIDGNETQKLGKRCGGCGNISQCRSGEGLPCTPQLIVSEQLAVFDGLHGSPAGVEFHGKRDDLKQKTQGKTGKYTNFKTLGHLPGDGWSAFVDKECRT